MANTELLQRVLQHIKDNPEEHDAQRWHKDFAGWTLRLETGAEVLTDDDGIETLFDVDGERIWITDIGKEAAKLLELTRDQETHLFCGGNTVADLEAYVTQFAAQSPVKVVPLPAADLTPVPAWAKQAEVPA